MYLGSTGTGYADCPLVCIYQWSPSGLKTNLSSNNPNAVSSKVGGGRAYEQYPRAHSGKGIWIDAAGSNPGTFTRYQVATGTYSTIIQPSGSNYLINNEYDFFVDGKGNVMFFFGAQSGGEGVTSAFDVYRWSSLGNTSTKLSGSANLLSQPVTGGSIQTVSSNASEGFVLRDGVLAWRETVTSTSTGRFGGMVTTVSGIKAAALGSTLRIQAAPLHVMVSGSSAYFVMGATQTVYRLVLP
jgi:hypothetical protein